MIKFVPLINFDINSLRHSFFITGFQGFGLVGYLSTKHIVHELRFKKIGFIKTKLMPEVTLYSKNTGLQYPFEVYAGTAGAHNVVVVVHHGTPVEKERTSYAEFLAKFAKRIEAREVILLGGLSQEQREDAGELYRWIPVNNTGIVFDDARTLEDRHIIGPLALTLMFIQAYGLRGVVILPFTDPFRPDPKASAVAVELVSRILGVKISVQRLMEEAAIIEAIEAEREKIERAMEEAERRSRLTYI